MYFHNRKIYDNVCAFENCCSFNFCLFNGLALFLERIFLCNPALIILPISSV